MLMKKWSTKLMKISKYKGASKNVYGKMDTYNIE